MTRPTAINAFREMKQIYDLSLDCFGVPNNHKDIIRLSSIIENNIDVLCENTET